eukprot:CAMPEP_0176425154 /NCGR_PEP_ID=MMETSP0127-20121128/11237_1 /TAXON_ID=938130 /ORGANISM="Platyophrya macrostoma, Strain WH" /LENGTH=330 /DNA_ID=CAMNT_0017806295 /DNA_START=20 /DNA_END=1012 /DNA_ORIENTATION=-
MISANDETVKSSISLGNIEKYLISKEIDPDTHLYPVYLATYFDDTKKESKKCIVKAISDLTAFQRELKVYNLDPHANILQCLEVIENHTISFGTYKDKSFNLIVLPYLENGDFFDYLTKIYLDERTVRFYIEHILNALEHLHKNGLAHRDIKPENILLDEKFNPILIDFGHTTEHSNARGPILFNSWEDATTPGIVPPEFYRGIGGYLGTQMDMFALGKLIFTLSTGMEPFRTTRKEDKFYHAIETGAWEAYWGKIESMAKRKWTNFDGFSPELKELLQGLLCANPSKRLSLDEIRSSKWYETVVPRAADEIQCAMLRVKLCSILSIQFA